MNEAGQAAQQHREGEAPGHGHVLAVGLVTELGWRGADWVEELHDGWTLRPPGRQATVQYEHTLVATRAADR